LLTQFFRDATWVLIAAAVLSMFFYHFACMGK
jgi:hypothetical protein